jgi:hypothetical protein
MKQTAVRIAGALLAFILGVIAHSLWSEFTTPQSTPPPVNASQSTVSEPVATGMAVRIAILFLVVD